MSEQYVRVRNRNTTHEVVSVEWLRTIGASSQRGLTGQGWGSKMGGVQSIYAGLKWRRASHDRTGPYIAWYELEDYAIDNQDRERVRLMVLRPGQEKAERLSMHLDANAFDNAWLESTAGKHYPIIREIILDAADEDSNFEIAKVPGVEFSPPGHTDTYIEIPEDVCVNNCKGECTCKSAITQVMEFPDYFFRKLGDIEWLDEYVGIGDVSAYGETRIYVTDAKAELSYVAWSNLSSWTPRESAFDYIMREDDKRKWASLPDRKLKDKWAAENCIMAAIKKISNPYKLRLVFDKMMQDGYEARLSWYRTDDWDFEVVRKAMRLITGGLPIHNKKTGDVLMMMAEKRQETFYVSNEFLYSLCLAAGVKTAKRVLGLRERGESRHRKMTRPEATLYTKARKGLESTFHWVNWSHQYMSLEHDSWWGAHTLHNGTDDVISINFERIIRDNGGDDAQSDVLVRAVQGVMMHELVHHALGEYESGDHGEDFAAKVCEVFAPPLTV